MAFVKEQFSVSERQACKLFALDRSTYRYEPRQDRNAQLRGEMIALAPEAAIRVPKIARHSDSACYRTPNEFAEQLKTPAMNG